MSARTHILLLCLLVAGCAPGKDPVDILADYNSRLARVLATEPPPAAAIRVPTWPASRDLLQETADVRVGLLEFLDFGRCGLLQEISERNSSLGRVQPASQRLLYELRMVRGLQQCAQLTAPDLAGADATRREFAGTVHTVLARKQQDLPLVYWNATFAAPEFREFFSVSALPLRPGDGAAVRGAAAAITTLASLGRLPATAPLPASDALEHQYYRLIGNRLGGRTWLSLDLAIRELDRASAMLEMTVPATLCPGGAPGPQAQRLRGVFDAAYVARVQPWLSETGGAADELVVALERLWLAQQVTAPEELLQYRMNVWSGLPGSLVQEYQLSVRRHAHAWQALLQPCGLAPTPPSP